MKTLKLSQPKEASYKIESNVPLPLTFKGGIKDLIFKMKEGDSFEFPASDKGKVNGSANYLKGRHANQFNYMIRKLSNSTYRLWRIPVEIKSL